MNAAEYVLLGAVGVLGAGLLIMEHSAPAPAAPADNTSTASSSPSRQWSWATDGDAVAYGSAKGAACSTNVGIAPSGTSDFWGRAGC